MNEALQETIMRAVLQARKDNATLREALKPRARDPLEQAIASVKERAHLRKGQPPSTDEILLIEVERLRALVQRLQDKLNT